jgi:hypothetical protein
MSPLDARTAKLLADVRRDWQQVKAHLERGRTVDPRSGAPQQALVALSLDHAYQAFETLLVRLERALGLPERSGTTWHAQILFESGEPLANLRPAVYPSSVAREWDELLRFRHFLRHAYVLELDAEKLAANLKRLERAVAATDPYIAALVQALEGEQPAGGE